MNTNARCTGRYLVVGPVGSTLMLDLLVQEVGAEHLDSHSSLCFGLGLHVSSDAWMFDSYFLDALAMVPCSCSWLNYAQMDSGYPFEWLCAS